MESSVHCAQQSSATFPSCLKSPVTSKTVSLSESAEHEDTEEAMVQETAALLASLSDVILSPIKAPKVSNVEQSDALSNNTEVSLRMH